MTNPDYTHLELIVDRSGSMRSIMSDMNGAINQLLDEQAKLPGKLTVTVTLFDNEVEQPHVMVPVSEVGRDLIVPRGTTSLLDAVGTSIVHLGKRLVDLPEASRPGKVLVGIVTDGRENSSREYTLAHVRELITQQREQYNWEFTYLGANVNAFAEAGAMGIPMGSAMNFASSAKGTRAAMSAQSAYLTDYRTSGTATFTDADRDDAMERSDD